MKRLAVILALMPLFIQAQDTIHYRYAEVVLATKAITGRVGTLFENNYFFDFGDGVVYTPDHPLKDEEGDEIEFAGPAQMLNWMDKKGWNLCQSFGLPAFAAKAMTSERWITYYVFRRPVKWTP